MLFALRDDDVCHHTDPSILVELYGGLSRRCPISFGCIPFVGGFDVASFPAEKWKQLDDHWIPWQTTESYPIGANAGLSSLLASWCSEARATVILHGIHHDLYEFMEERPFDDEIAEAKRHLEDVARRPVSVASAPNNSFGISATVALARRGFNLLVSLGHRPWERPPSIRNYLNFTRLLLLSARHRRTQRLTRPLRFPNHWEQGCYDLGPRSDVDEMFRGIDRAARGGNFIVATHYYHLARDERLRKVLDELVAYARRRAKSGVRFVTAEELFPS